jgi:ABC-type bacteriocin/lantibiotic exporter with double-glycine peptidase domain
MVLDNLDSLGCTTIVIAHCLSTIRSADHILVMEKEGSWSREPMTS